MYKWKFLFLIPFLFSFSGSNLGIKDSNWIFLNIHDYENGRNINCQAANASFYFGEQHLHLNLCGETLGKFYFNLPGRIEVLWDEFSADSCAILDQQIRWYCRYRMRDLLYQVEGDTLELRDKSGVRFRLLRSAVTNQDNR